MLPVLVIRIGSYSAIIIFVTLPNNWIIVLNGEARLAVRLRNHQETRRRLVRRSPPWSQRQRKSSYQKNIQKTNHQSNQPTNQVNKLHEPFV